MLSIIFTEYYVVLNTLFALMGFIILALPILLPGTALVASADRLAATRGPGQNQPQGVDYGGGALRDSLGGAG